MTINTKEDLKAIEGTSEYEQFMTALRGSLFDIYKDNDKWFADESNDVIERFGLTRADFDPIEQPALPVNKTAEELASRDQAVINKESRSYLNATDWYVTRESETGVAAPDDVTQLRSDAREAVA